MIYSYQQERIKIQERGREGVRGKRKKNEGGSVTKWKE